jgi:transposase
MLKRLGKLLRKMIQQTGYVKAAETTLSYLHDEGQGKASKGWLWVFLAPELGSPRKFSDKVQIQW